MFFSIPVVIKCASTTILQRRIKCLGRNCYPYSQDEKRNKRRDLGEQSPYYNWRKICPIKNHNAVVRNLSDILNEEGNFMSFSEFTRKYMMKTNFLRYFGLCNAIPASWKETLICGVDNCEINSFPSPSDLGNWTCQYARSFYISKIF